MDAIEKKIILKATADEETAVNSNSKSHNPGLRALMALKNFTATLEGDYTKLLQLENDLNELNKKALLIISTNTSTDVTTRWKEILQEANNAINGINETLTSAKKKVDEKAKEGYSELWNQLSIYLVVLKENSKNASNTGLNALPESIHYQWENEFVKVQIPMLQSIITHVESCRVLLQIIERYTPDELNIITQIIIDQIPLDFTYQEAVDYQNDYYKALVNFKKEFKEEKNLWDKFLDILAGGTHQSPSERVMMERWLEGEKGDL